MLISPAINIGIGKYGASCVQQLAANFILREELFLDYLSFHQLELAEEMILPKTYYQDEFRFENRDIETTTDNDWLLGNFLSTAYNHLINLKHELSSKINFGAIHINLFFSAFETGHLELLCQTILKIDKLKEQGIFGEVQVKCYSVLSDGRALSTSAQEESIAKTLQKLVEIRKEYNILSHIFIFDDKNTQAISLGIHRQSLPFAMMEIIIALLQNEYRMTGSLHSENRIFAIGMGMVYFDQVYFKSFMKNKILESKIRLENIYEGEKNISTEEYREIVSNYVIPYLKGEKSFEDLIDHIENATTPCDFKNTMRCYEFLLLNLLGKHDDIKLVTPVDKEELYSIQDIIYHKIYEQILSESERAEKKLLDLKEYKKRASKREALEQEGSSKSEIISQQLIPHENSVNDLIKYYNISQRRREILIKSKINLYKKTIKELETKGQNLIEDFKNKNLFAKWSGKRKYRESKIELEKQIVFNYNLLEEEESSLQTRTSNFQSELEELYKLKARLNSKLSGLLKGKKDIFNLKEEYQKRIDNLPYLDYEYLHNIISKELLLKYEDTHQAELQTNIKEVLRILYDESNNHRINFREELNKNIETQVNDIIDFKMLDYLLNEYDQINLFKPYDFTNDLKRLKQRAFPFFNAVPTYTPNPHFLKYFNDENKGKTERLQQLLKENYTANIPAFIRAKSNNKFGLMTIEMVEDLKDIVKYNNHHQRANVS